MEISTLIRGPKTKTNTYVVFGRHLKELHTLAQAPLGRFLVVLFGFLDAIAAVIIVVVPSAVTEVGAETG